LWTTLKGKDSKQGERQNDCPRRQSSRPRNSATDFRVILSF
jgi:hypothetical protein